DVLPAADDRVLDPPDNADITVGVHLGQVAGVHPAGGVDGLGGLLRVLPIAAHDHVAAGAELPAHAAGHDQVGLRVEDPDLHVRVHPAHGPGLPVQVVADAGLGGHRGGLGHAVADGHLVHAQVAD